MRMFSKYSLFILLWIVLLQGCMLHKYQVKRKIKQEIKTGKNFDQAHTGLVVYDPFEKKALLDINGDKYFTPASNTKLFTFYAAKKIIRDSIPALSYCIHQDTLYFTGTGDPTFLHPDFKNQPVFDFLLERNLPMVYVPQNFMDQRYGPGWAWDDFQYYFSAEKSSFPIYGNMIWLNMTLQDTAIDIIPSLFKDQMVIIEDSTFPKNKIELTREEFYNRFYLSYNPLSDTIEEVIPFNYSDELFTYLLSDTLKKPVLMKESFPFCKKRILYNVHVDSVLRPFLLYSDNFFGEQLLVVSSYILRDTLDSKTAISYAENNFFKSFGNEIYWVDGSGLSRYNQFTPEAMIHLLEFIYSDFPVSFIKNTFPAGGSSGTLKNNFKATSPYIYAKTGSMTHVYNLSGFLITKEGRWLIFSFMNNNHSGSMTDLKAEMERILELIRHNF